MSRASGLHLILMIFIAMTENKQLNFLTWVIMAIVLRVGCGALIKD